MTIEAIARVREYLGNGGTVAFDTGFAFFAASDLKVYLRDADGDEALQTLGAGYTVSGGNGTRGTVTFTVAPATGLTVVIRSRTAISQQAEYPDGGKFPALTVERSFDRATAIDQEQQDQIDELGTRAPLVPPGEIAPAFPRRALRQGKFLAFDAAGEAYPADGTGADGALRSDLGAADGARIVGFRQAADAGVRTTENKVRDLGISPRDAPGFVDADVDQMAAVQWAIDKCLSFDPPAPLDVAGLFRADVNGATNKALMLNRPVDQSKSRFMINARGAGAGFRIIGNGNLFDTTLTFNGTDPCSEMIGFRDILFLGTVAPQAAQTFAPGKFLRMEFDNVAWERQTCMGTTTYAQEWDFIGGCRARNWSGIFFEAAGAYAINAQMKCKFGGSVFRLVGARGVTQSSFTGGTYEALSGPVLTAGGCAGVAVHGNYIEYNAAPGINLGAGVANTSFSLFGNIFIQAPAQLADTSFYDVIWGQTRRGMSFGNTCNGRLHDATGVTGLSNQVVLFDLAMIELYKGYKAGLLDQSRAATGNVLSLDAGFLAQAQGQAWSGLDGAGVAFGPGTVQAGGYVPIRQIYGAQNPQSNPAFYGNPYWSAGSIVWNVGATGDGQVDYWRCVASGQPGTWRAQILQ